MGKLDGKVALITGAAGGIGAATAKLFASQGAQLVLADITPLAAAPGVLTLHLDVTDEAAWAAAASEALTRFGRLDVLVNNAGIFKMAPLEQTSVAMFEPTVRINQLGVFLGMRAAQLQDAALAGVAAGTPLGRLATADDVAAMALFLASDDSSYSTGSEFVCDGGMSMA